MPLLQPQPTNTIEIIQALTPLIDVFERLEIAYYIGGSVASSLYGKRRSTQDIDLIANIQPAHVQILVKYLENEYYIDGDMIRDALRHHSSFNILHNDTGLKVDIFILKPGAFAQQEMHRARPEVLEAGTRPFSVASPEDTILSKLAWWKLGGGASSRQWNDLLEVFKKQVSTLDTAYLQRSAPLAGVTDLLAQALHDAGLPPL